MKVEYRIREEDYVEAMKLYSRLMPRSLLLYLGITAMLGMLATTGSPLVSSAAIGGLVGGVIAVVLGRYLLVPLLARRHYRNYKANQELFSVELLHEGVRFSSATAEGILHWDKILKWRQNDDYVLIYIMPRLYHIGPKSIETKGFDIAELVRQLKSFVGDER